MPVSSTKTLYETDFYEWTQCTIEALRNRDFGQIDVDALIEEVGDLGRSERRELMNHLSVLLAHKLKHDFQPDKQTRSWEATIKIQRLDVLTALEESPSLQSSFEELVHRAYKKAVLLASNETQIDQSLFPSQCPYSCDQILS